MVQLSTEQYPTSLRESWDIHYLKNTPCPESRRQLSRGVLTIDHISGSAQFPCPRPCVFFQRQGPFIPSLSCVRFSKGCYHWMFHILKGCECAHDLLFGDVSLLHAQWDCFFTAQHNCSIQRRPLHSYSLVCSKKYLFILGIRPICDKEL